MSLFMYKRIEPVAGMTLYDKVMLGEVSRLEDRELLAVVAGYDDVCPLERLYDFCSGDLSSLAGKSGDAISKAGRMGKRQSARVAAAMMLVGRMAPQRPSPPDQIKTDMDVKSLMADDFYGKSQEELWALYLTGGNRLIEKRRISVGGTSAVVSDVKIVVRRAVELLAAAVIIVHNHPSGNAEPSGDDTELTQKLAQACSLFDIRLLDHIIIGHNEHWSFLKRGLL